MQTVIDSHILNDFFGSKPSEINTDKDIEKFEEWTQFREFIKSKSDLVITNYKELTPSIWQLMTAGRGETTLLKEEKRTNTHGGLISHDYSPATFFCLVEPADKKRKRIRTKNGYLIAFENDYYNKWIDLSFKKKNTLLPVDKNNVNSFKSWNDFDSILLPFTDVIISDSYILSDISLIQSNLLTLWEKLDSLTPVRYNFLIVTHEGNPRMDIKKEYDKLNEFRIRKKLKANLSLVFTTNIDKEHDRNIFMNYIRLKSGDSFNFFDSKQRIVSKGTEIDIYSCSDPQKEKATLSILKRVSDIIKNTSEDKILSNNAGNVINRLLID